jgi:hypothetical protein
VQSLLALDDSPESHYHVALIFARLRDLQPEDRDQMVRWLIEAFHRDLRYAAIAADDPELQVLADHPQWRRWFDSLAPLLEVPTPSIF